MSLRHPEATEKRLDYSRYFVHLTRDDRKTDSQSRMTAEVNFANILDSGHIANMRPHCLHGGRVPEDHLEDFRVACFTETPLTEIKNLIGVARRQVNLEPYGFVFERKFLIRKGAQPAIYVNNYTGWKRVRKGYDDIFERAVQNNFSGDEWRILPFVNVMNEYYDFAWEREWRVARTVNFASSDLVCVVLPDGETKLRDQALAKGVHVFDVEWTYERTVWEFVRQSREMREVSSSEPAALRRLFKRN